MRDDSLAAVLAANRISRRSLLKFAAIAAAGLALPPGMAATIADNLIQARRQSVIWLSFQQCSGCVETLTRSERPSVESLIFDYISLDYQETLMAASGEAAEQALRDAAAANHGQYLLAIDGSIPTDNDGVYSMTGGRTALELLRQYAPGAKAVLAIGTCAAYGGIPKAKPNPTGAVGVEQIIGDKPLINIPGCPPIPEVLTGVLVNFLSFGRLPDMDAQKRPLAYFGTTIHEQCYRRPFYDEGKFAKSFDDEGARQGWCLFELGCKGPTTHNACASVRWNGNTSFPIESGHGCLGCSEPDFWDKGSFYTSLSGGQGPDWKTLAIAGGIGVALGAAAAASARQSRKVIDRQVTEEQRRQQTSAAEKGEPTS